jgi:uncharacterized membrane protein YhaH (DUF805 family)
MNHQLNPDLPPVPSIPGWFSYSGRYTRSQFWKRWLPVSFLTFIVTRAVGVYVGNKLAISVEESGETDGFLTQIWMFSILETVVMTVLLLPLFVKRLHDVSISTVSAVVIWSVVQIIGFVELYVIGPDLENIVRAETLQEILNAAGAMNDTVMLCDVIRVVLGIILLVIMCRDSYRGTNEYGPSMKYPSA